MSDQPQPDPTATDGRAAAGGTPPTGVPTLDEVKEWLGIATDDTVDDAVLQTSLDAAIAAQGRVCDYPTNASDEPVVDPDQYEALLLRTQRYTARRSSPEGVVGITGTSGDFAAARLPSVDADIVRLEGPWLRTPVA